MEETWTSSIMPVCTGDYIALIGISSPLAANTPQSEFFNTKNKKGETIFKIIKIGKSCDACKTARVLCPHDVTARPAGLSAKKREDFANFYSDKNKMMREFAGHSNNTDRIVFHREWLDALAKRKCSRVPAIVDALHVSMDPAQGGRCMFAVCACYYHDDAQHIVQMDAFSLEEGATNENIKALLYSVISKLRGRHPAFAVAPVVIACESAPKIIGENLNSYLLELVAQGAISGVYMMCEAPGGRPGVVKDNERTQQMVHWTGCLLEQNRVYFSEVFGTANDEHTPEEAMLDWYAQMRNVQIKFLPRMRPDLPERVRIDGKSGSRNDDRFTAHSWNFWAYLYYHASGKAIYKEPKDYSAGWRSGHVGIKPVEGSRAPRRFAGDRLVLQNDPDINPIFVAPPSPEAVLDVI